MSTPAGPRCALASARLPNGTVLPALAFVFAALGSHSATALPRGIYLLDDDPQTIHLTDQPIGTAPHLLVESEASGGSVKAPMSTASSATFGTGALPAGSGPVAADIAEIARSAAQRYNVAPELLHAVIGAESGYSARAVSPRGALGLMQLMPETAKSYGVADPFDPRQNVEAGARHLRRLIDQFGRDTTLALAAYNAGAGAVVRYGYRVPPFDETVAFVPRVLRRVARLQALPAAQSSIQGSSAGTDKELQ